MRKLTIKREKTFVACLVKMKFYIEDHTSNEILINDVPCRKLGEIKNNDEQSFYIDNNEAKVFVIADKASKNYCNEFYQLPEGDDDITLSGKNKFNLASGNAFRFNNNTNEEALANRKKGANKGISVLISASVVGLIIGLTIGSFLNSNKDKDFSCMGMTITLTNNFVKANYEAYDAVFDSEKVAVFVLKEGFNTISDAKNISLEEYRKLVIEANSILGANKKSDGDLLYFEHNYTDPETKDNLKYYTFVYKTNDAFWIVQFAIYSEDSEEYSDDILKWAHSVRFDK